MGQIIVNVSHDPTKEEYLSISTKDKVMLEECTTEILDSIIFCALRCVSNQNNSFVIFNIFCPFSTEFFPLLLLSLTCSHIFQIIKRELAK